MIQSRIDYFNYLKQDRKALGVDKLDIISQIFAFLSPNHIWKFQKLLRKLEYYTNCRNKGIYKLYILILRYKFKNISLKLGFSIPINVFGPGLSIVHYGTIVINRASNVGSNCRIHACVNINVCI